MLSSIVFGRRRRRRWRLMHAAEQVMHNSSSCHSTVNRRQRAEIGKIAPTFATYYLANSVAERFLIGILKSFCIAIIEFGEKLFLKSWNGISKL